MKRNILATLIAALLVIGLLGLAAAQGATTSQDVEGFGAEWNFVSSEGTQLPS